MNRGRPGSPLRASAIMLFVLLAAACSSTGGPSSGGGSANLITREQIEMLPEGTAYTVIQRFRSGWLRPRTQATFGNAEPAYAEVFVDELRYGDISSLSRINSSQIETIEYISATDATTRYGTGYMGGIIRVNTRGR
ncbi:MAG TPA: hypothetical protein VMM35_07630 [Longimicrobiales bacterium]|nr:hypothetical protein [Longimicrobiales bacterium]